MIFLKNYFFHIGVILKSRKLSCSPAVLCFCPACGREYHGVSGYPTQRQHKAHWYVVVTCHFLLLKVFLKKNKLHLSILHYKYQSNVNRKKHINFCYFVFKGFIGGWDLGWGGRGQGGVLFSLNFTLTNIFTVSKMKIYFFLSLYQNICLLMLGILRYICNFFQGPDQRTDHFCLKVQFSHHHPLALAHDDKFRFRSPWFLFTFLLLWGEKVNFLLEIWEMYMEPNHWAYCSGW